MTPEVGHIQAGGRAGDSQSGKAIGCIGRCFIHVINIFTQLKARQLVAVVLALAALLIGQADEVALQQVQVQVQAGGPLHDVLVDVLAFAVFGVIAVELLQAVARQIEVRHCDSLVAQHRAVVAPDGYAVVGDGHIYRDLLGGRLIVVVLRVQSVGGLLHRDGKGHGDGLAVRAGRLDLRLIGAGVLFRDVERPARYLGLGAEACLIGQRVGQRMAVRVLENVSQLDLQQAAGHHLTGGDCARLHCHTRISRPYRHRQRGQQHRQCKQERA